MKRIRPEWWIVGLGLLARTWLAWTRAHWDHPDEWYQTLELAQVMRGTLSGQTWGIYSQEIDLHLRNLTLPGVFALLLAAVSKIAAGSLHAPLFAAQLLSSLWSLGLVAALWRWARPHRWFPAALFAWAFLPFWAVENTKPSAENWAVHAFFWALFFLQGKTRREWGLAGVALALAAVFKFPALLLVAGFAWGVWRSALHTYKWRAITLGFGAGMILTAIPDWIFYGLPAESFFAYLQYNVLTPLGADTFGRQSAWIYLDYLKHHWLTTALPLSLWVARYLPRGLGHGFSRHAPWAAAAAFYLLGHLLIGHKEGRFLVPLEGLLIFAAGMGTALELQWSRRTRIVGGVLTVLAVLLGAKTWRGDLQSVSGSYMNLARLSEAEMAQVCGVATVRRMHSFLLPPAARNPQNKLAVAVLQMQENSRVQTIWDRTPQCAPGDSVLVHLPLPTLPDGCGAMPHLGTDWQRCDADRMDLTQTQSPYIRSIPRVQHYPRLGRAGILELMERKSSPRCTIAWCGSV